MTLNTFKSDIWLNIKNIPGLRTKRKILVIEADDYGSTRIPSLSIQQLLTTKGYIKPKNVHDDHDTMETSDDLNAMFTVLKSFRDKNGNYAKMTPYFISSNPDSRQIQMDNFEKYSYKTYAKCLVDYSVSSSIHDLWKEGVSGGFFKPQYHGREHVNVPKLMELLSSDAVMRDAISMDFFHPILKNHSHYKRLRPAFYFETEEEKEYLKKSLVEGIDLFYNYFDYKPSVFCPSNGVFHDDFKPILKANGISTFVESGVRYIPDGKGGVQVRRKFIFGEKDQVNKTINYSRNVTFEPTRDSPKQSVDKALSEIKIAFRWGKPAVIATHRNNFCGTFDVKNRETSLAALETLLKRVKEYWPDVEFMNSGELATLIHTSNKEF